MAPLHPLPPSAGEPEGGSSPRWTSSRVRDRTMTERSEGTGASHLAWFFRSGSAGSAIWTCAKRIHQSPNQERQKPQRYSTREHRLAVGSRKAQRFSLHPKEALEFGIPRRTHLGSGGHSIGSWRRRNACLGRKRYGLFIGVIHHGTRESLR